MEFSSLEGGNDGDHNGVSFVETSEIIATQKAFFVWTESFERVYVVENSYFPVLIGIMQEADRVK